MPAIASHAMRLGEVLVADVEDSELARSRWHTDLVAEGVTILQAALPRDRLGEYQAQAAIAALHCDARSTAETDWVQVVEGTTSWWPSPTRRCTG